MTFEEWKTVVFYDHLEGTFRWREVTEKTFLDLGLSVPRWWRARYAMRAGDEAGHVDGGRVILARFNSRIRAHKLAWYIGHGSEPPEYIDHINGDPTDNRLKNLREATHRQNMCNRRPAVGCHSKFLGVEYCIKRKTFRAVIKSEYGVFRGKMTGSELEAAAIYNKIAPILNGEFARLNCLESPGKTYSAKGFV
ncbi:MAG: HNH endonuclease [Rhodobacteraceae bacterium]|nr:HNH endonuclease [Paracoccaceae bacterium]